MSDMVIGDDGWTEIVGEQSRGGHTVGKDVAFEILGEISAKSPAFAAYVEKRAAASRPMVSKTPFNKARDWQIDFGPVSGAAGTTTVISVVSQTLFRGEKVMATDDGGSKTAGYNTRVSTILIGNKLQRPAGTSTLTAFFANNALGNGVKWDTCQRGLTMAMTVSFVTASTFECTVFGKSVEG